MRTSADSPKLRKRTRFAPLLIAGGVAVLLFVIVGSIVIGRFVSKYGITELADRKFGDQHLKTTVALLELHKIRFGKYPETLKELKYTGDWDQLWTGGMAYYPSEDRHSYYVEVVQGWVAKPTLVMPTEFWQNTGYSERLKPKN